MSHSSPAVSIPKIPFSLTPPFRLSPRFCSPLNSSSKTPSTWPTFKTIWISSARILKFSMNTCLRESILQPCAKLLSRTFTFYRFATCLKSRSTSVSICILIRASTYPVPPIYRFSNSIALTTKSLTKMMDSKWKWQYFKIGSLRFLRMKKTESKISSLSSNLCPNTYHSTYLAAKRHKNPSRPIQKSVRTENCCSNF